ncbi:hypothetical protein [Enterococcus sp. LJL51]|uniref:hypothetical protein n=1 Tax=Enterococcus sp. LJL51 TaxID=3416656 RepID=UPI003CE91FF9
MKKKDFLIVAPLLFLISCENHSAKTELLESTITTSSQLFTTESSVDFSTEEKLPEYKLSQGGETYTDIISLPETQTKKPINELRKIVYDQSGWHTVYNSPDFFADLKNKNMNLYPYNNIGRIEPDWTITKKDVSKIQKIIEDNNVQNWKRIYGVKPDPERTSNSEAFWTLILVFDDDTIEFHEAYYDEDSPEEYENFIKELLAFREEKREEWRKTLD